MARTETMPPETPPTDPPNPDAHRPRGAAPNLGVAIEDLPADQQEAYRRGAEDAWRQIVDRGNIADNPAMARERGLLPRDDDQRAELEAQSQRTRPLRTGEKYYPVRGPSGFPIDIPWPIDIEVGRERMRQILGHIEESADPRGGDVNQLEYQDMTLIIQYYSEQADPNLVKLSREMKQELNARLALHQAFLTFSHAPDIENAANSLKDTLSSNQDVLFGIEQITDALGFFEDLETRELYISGTEENQEKARTRVKIALAKKYKGLSQNEIETNLIDQKKLDEMKWAQNLGEILWQVTGRMVIFDELQTSDVALKPGEARDQQKQEFRLQYLSGGNFAMRRLQDYAEWYRTRATNERPHVELLEGVDLEVWDYLSSIPDNVERYELRQCRINAFDKLVDQYRAEGKTIQEAGRLAGERLPEFGDEIKRQAEANTARIIGHEKINKIDRWTGKEVVDSKTGKPVKTWPMGRQLNLSKIQWKEVEFQKIFGDLAMSYWAAYQLNGPDKFRDATMKSPESYLRNPSVKGLAEVAKMLGFLSGRMYPAQMKLIENYINFESKGGKYHKGKLRPIDKDVLISDIAEAVNLRIDEVVELKKNVHFDNLAYQIAWAANYVEIVPGLRDFFMEIIKGMLADIGKEIK